MEKFIEEAKKEVNQIYSKLNKMFGFKDDGKRLVGEEIDFLTIFENEKVVQIQHYLGGDDFVFVMELNKKTGKWVKFYDDEPEAISFTEVKKLFEDMKKQMLSDRNLKAINCGLIGTGLGKLIGMSL